MLVKFNFELPEFEIDSDEDSDFGALYRVWKSYQFAGSFYQNLDGEWVVQTLRGENSVLVNTSEEAYLTLVSLRSESTGVDIDSLLDKPFDELTAAEWQYLMAHSPNEQHLEAVAA